MFRDAKTTGRVYGRRQTSKGWLDWGEMSLSADALVVNETQPGGPQISLSGDRFTVSRTIEVRR
jgi:hypothetical protein